MVDIISFDEAISDSRRSNKRHIILGNGFSIACKPEIFVYGTLFSKADFSAHPNVPAVFRKLGTEDFEIVIRYLESSADILGIYAPHDEESAKKMRIDASALKDILLRTISRNHPNIPSDIADASYYACRKFLRYFLGGENDGHLFTLNYDLLLYWALMHEDNPFTGRISLNINDGFGNDDDDPNADYVVWHGDSGARSSKIHFLHGALHLYDAGDKLKKFTWVRKNERLIDQARSAISMNYFPLFVAEGDSESKLNKIQHSAYLFQGRKYLFSNATQKTHCFFIYGHSLAGNDSHILNAIEKGKCRVVYISIFGDPETETNTQIIRRAELIAASRPQKSPLEVKFYDASSAKVWG